MSISERARKALAGLPPVTTLWRWETYECLGVYLIDDEVNHVLPVDPTQRRLIAILNSELRKENPSVRFEEQVEFDDISC